MRSLFQEDARRDVVARLQRLDPSATPRWGRMNAPQMVEHLANALRMAFGDVTCRERRLPLRWTPIKQLIIYVLPFPRGAPTAAELLQPPAGDFPQSVADCRALVQRFAHEPAERAWPRHPAFGALSRRDWGVLAYKHMDHHLTQFGV
jgi:hypothetical protein